MSAGSEHAPGRRKNNRFTFHEKKNLIREIENSISDGNVRLAIERVCRKYEIHCSTLMSFWETRDKIQEACLNGHGHLKCLSRGKDPSKIAENFGRDKEKIPKHCPNPGEREESERGESHETKWNYKSKDIYLAAELGLFYRAKIDECTTLAGERCDSADKNDERFTVLTIANLTGTDRRKLTVVGNSTKPRSNPRVDYHFDSTSWMKSEFFEMQLRDWDEKLQRQNRKILLLTEKTPVHKQIKDLKNITVEYHDDIDAEKRAPFDMVRCMKAYYRWALLENMKSGKGIDANVAINELHDAWQRVSADEIRSSFAEAGIINEVKKDMYLSVIEKWWKSLRQENDQYIDLLKTYTDCDNQLVTSANSPDEDNEGSDQLVTVEEALAAVQTVKNYFGQTEGRLKSSPFKYIDDIEKEIRNDRWEFRLIQGCGTNEDHRDRSDQQNDPGRAPTGRKGIPRRSPVHSDKHDRCPPARSQQPRQRTNDPNSKRASSSGGNNRSRTTNQPMAPAQRKRRNTDGESQVPEKQPKGNAAHGTSLKRGFPAINPSIRRALLPKNIELRLCGFVAEQNCFRIADRLGELISVLDPSSILSKVQFSRNKCIELITHVIGPCLLQNLIKDLGDSNFSLLIDGRTNASGATLCLMLKYFSKERKKIATTFYRIIQIEYDSSREVLFNAIARQLAEDKLDIRKLIGIGTEGESMAGTKLSFFKSEIPDLIFIKCTSKSLRICVDIACKELPGSLDALLKGWHNYFKRWPEKLAAYHEFCGEQAAIPNVDGIPWVARKEAIDVVLHQWGKLWRFFNGDECAEATKLVEKMKPAYRAFLIFLRYSVLEGEISRTYEQLQNTNSSFKIFEYLLRLYKRFLAKIIDPTKMENVTDDQLVNFEFQSHVMPLDSINLGSDFNDVFDQVKPSDKEDVKTRCVKFITTFCSQLRLRLPPDVNLITFMPNFEPERSTSQKKREIVQLFEGPSRFNLKDCQEEWDNLATRQWGEAVEDGREFWVRVSEEVDGEGKEKFKNISDLALSLLSVPMPNAFDDRCFSICKSIKLGNGDFLEFAQNLMLLKYYLWDNNLSCVKFKPTRNMNIRLLKDTQEDKINTSPIGIRVINKVIEQLCTLLRDMESQKYFFNGNAK